MFSNPFGLSHDDYWSNPWKNATELIDRYVFGEEFGVYIDAPRRVDLNEHRTVPMLVFYASMERDRAQLVFEDVAKVVVSDVRRRTVTVADAMEPSEPVVQPIPFDPTSSEPTSTSAETDLATYGGIRGPGDYVVTVLLRDRTSNRVRIEVGRPPTGYQDSEVERYLDAQRRARPSAWPEPPRPAEGSPYPSYREAASSPPTPITAGLSASIERVVDTSKTSRCVLSASFYLPVFEADRLPPEDPSAPSEIEYGAPRPTGIIPVTVVSVGTTEVAQRVLALRVPTSDSLEPDGEAPLATGYFSLDLFDGFIDPQIAQTHFIYLFSGEYMSGPHATAIVTPSMVQG